MPRSLASRVWGGGSRCCNTGAFTMFAGSPECGLGGGGVAHGLGWVAGAVASRSAVYPSEYGSSHDPWQKS